MPLILKKYLRIVALISGLKSLKLCPLVLDPLMINKLRTDHGEFCTLISYHPAFYGTSC